MLDGKRILLIIGGGVAAYKSLDLARRLMERGASVRGVLTPAGQQFITPMSVASLTGDECYTELFSVYHLQYYACQKLVKKNLWALTSFSGTALILP